MWVNEMAILNSIDSWWWWVELVEWVDGPGNVIIPCVYFLFGRPMTILELPSIPTYIVVENLFPFHQLFRNCSLEFTIFFRILFTATTDNLLSFYSQQTTRKCSRPLVVSMDLYYFVLCLWVILFRWMDKLFFSTVRAPGDLQIFLLIYSLKYQEMNLSTSQINKLIKWMAEVERRTEEVDFLSFPQTSGNILITRLCSWLLSRHAKDE